MTNIGVKLPITAKTGFFGKFHPCHSSLLIVPDHAVKLETNPLSGSWDTRLYNFGPQSGQTCPFCQKEESWEILLRDFSMLNVPYQCAKFEKKKPVTDREI